MRVQIKERYRNIVGTTLDQVVAGVCPPTHYNGRGEHCILYICYTPFSKNTGDLWDVIEMKKDVEINTTLYRYVR